MRPRAVAIVLMLAVSPAAASAQIHTGRIDASITDLTGAALPGASVDVSGPQHEAAVTDVRGAAHFLNLPPGTYTVRARRSGFSDYLNKHVVVGTGTSVALEISMTVEGVATQVQVRSDSPILDTKKTTTVTNIGLDELQYIPSARDPWVVLQTIPGVIVDRVNVGGAESGQQSTYQAKGASSADNTWNVDGIPITDMAATGSTPSYYDFDMFQEVQVVTGGAAVQSATPGIQLNLVLKSGTNAPRGSARGYFENESLQGNNLPPNLASTIGGTSGKGNRTHLYDDYGAEAGGPLAKDRLWIWGAAGKTHVDVITLNGSHDRSELQDTAIKATGRLTSALRANVTFFRSDKQKFGRGAAPDRAPVTTQDQAGPTSLYAGEATYAGHGLYVAAKTAHLAAGFTLTPEGGTSKSLWRDDSGRYHDTFDVFATRRPQGSAALDASAFRGRHELKFGAAWRKADVRSTDSYPGTGIITYHVGYPEMLAQVTRDYATLTSTNYWSAYAGDGWTIDRLTVNLGVRWDRQASSLGAASVPASRALPSILPAATAAPVNDAIVWNAVTPRAGVTWTMDAARKTVARAAYSMFSSQLGAAGASFISPIQRASITYLLVDQNLNKVADPEELTGSLALVGYSGFDLLDPARLTTVNQIGRYTTPVTHEVQIGVDRELWPFFGISATLTYRYLNHFNWTPLTGVDSSDYDRVGTLTGNVAPIGPYTVRLFALPLAKVPAGGGRTYEEHAGYHQRFLGAEVSATKRLADGWMGRFSFSSNDHREYFNGPHALDDPAPSPVSPSMNGGLVVTQSAGSGQSSIFMVLPRYQVTANTMYQTRWGVNLAANLLVRQGYAMPFYAGSVLTTGASSYYAPLKDVLVVDDIGRFRLPALKSLDARVEKTLGYRRANIAIDLDVFNATNRATPLGRQYDIRLTGATGFNQELEIMNPRIVRLGIRVSF